MRVRCSPRLLVAAVVGAGATLAAIALAMALSAPAVPLALLAAAVVLTELIRVPSDESSPDPADANEFSFSSGVHIASVLVLGPWAAALVASFGVVLVDGIRGARWRQILYNAAVFVLAAVAAGLAFSALGGRPGGLELPRDLAAVAALGLTYYLVNTLLVSGIVALTAERSFASQVRATVRGQVLSAAGEVGFGVTLALFALTQPWAAILLAPLVLALFQAHSRLAQLRRETSRALETFANVVDERDPSTYRHSQRVAEYVRRLGEALGLDASEVNRLRWAGRLHDLGKITVDGSVLRKPGRLSPTELEAMRRHPRLSARLIRPFRFAAEQARAVEYHHERYDGNGYYGVDGAALPLAAHLLIVADSFDAMTSDRSYRRGLGREEALAEIERASGSQFHPAVARAFVAMERGLDPAAVLSPEERAELRGADAASRRALAVPAVRPERLGLAAVVAALGCLAAGWALPAAIGLSLGLAALAWRRIEIARGIRLARLLRSSLAARQTASSFAEVVEPIAAHTSLCWAALVSWSERDANGALVGSWGEAVPSEPALLSWLVRDLEAGDLRVALGAEIGVAGTVAGLPLTGDGIRSGYLVVGFARSLPQPVEHALGASGDAISAAATPFVRPAAPAWRRLSAL